MNAGLGKRLVTSYSSSAMSRRTLNPLEQLNTMYTLALSISRNLWKKR